MELKDYLAILWRRWKVIIATLVVTLNVVIIGLLVTTPIYTASSTLRIATASGGTVNYSDYMYADRIMNTYVSIATSSPVMDELKQQLGQVKLPQIEVKIVPNTELIQILVEDPDPALAATTANTLTSILITQSQDLYSGGGKSPQDILSEQLQQMETELNQAQSDYEKLVTNSPNDVEAISAASRALEVKQQIYASLLEQYEQTRIREAIRANTLSIVEPAVYPEAPSKPNRLLNIILGFMVGLIGGVGLAFLFENLDSTLYTTKQVEKATQLTALGQIPNIKVHKQTLSVNGNSIYREAFRRLRTNIFMQDGGVPQKALLITSAEPGEGKSTTVANLAYVIAQSNRSVIVVDCDLRLPTLHKLFQLPNTSGLSDYLCQEAAINQISKTTKFPRVKVITSGPLPSNPMELLSSPKMSILINALTQQYDVVLLDTPSIVQVGDAAVLVPMVDGVLLVVMLGETKEEAILDASKQLEDARARSIGLVVNGVRPESNYYYYNKGTKVKSK
jgi:non-specific protein-tyrosine kinase